MKKISIFILAFLLVGGAAFAQDQNIFTIGPKIGISSSKINFDQTDRVQAGDARVGFHAGLFTRLTFDNFYLQPEAYFISAGGTIKIADTGTQNYNRITKLTYNRLDVPVLFGIIAADFLRINVGPVFSLVLNTDARNDGTFEDVKTNYKNSRVAYQAGLGVDIGNLTVDLRYEGNLSKFGTGINVGNTEIDTDLRASQLLLSLGFKLF